MAGSGSARSRRVGMSRTTPTISRGRSPETTLSVKRFPMGSSPGQKRRAMASLMMTTQDADAVSNSFKSRPRTMRVFIVAKKLGVIRKYTARKAF